MHQEFIYMIAFLIGGESNEKSKMAAKMAIHDSTNINFELFDIYCCVIPLFGLNYASGIHLYDCFFNWR